MRMNSCMHSEYCGTTECQFHRVLEGTWGYYAKNLQKDYRSKLCGYTPNNKPTKGA